MTNSPRAFAAALEASAFVNEISKREFIGPRQYQAYVEARHMAMAALRTLRPNVSFPITGEYFRRDHTTVISAMRRHKKRLSESARYAEKYARVLDLAQAAYAARSGAPVFRSTRAMQAKTAAEARP